MDEKKRQQMLVDAMDTYGDYIVRLCYTYVRNWQTAEDLAQETFLKFYEALPKYRAEASVKTYIFRVAVNCCHNYLGSWKYKKVHISNMFQQLLTSHSTPEQQLLAQSDNEQLVRAIEALPTKYKDVIVLFHFAQLSLQDCAYALKLPVNTVKTRLRRARQLLGNTLIGEEKLYGSN